MWQQPTNLPNLSSAKLLSIDIETKDPNLHSDGPGNIRKDGHIVGIAIATDDGFSQYFPIGHLQGFNLDKDVVKLWLNDTFKDANQPKIGSKLIYDLGWLKSEGVEVRGRKYDIQIAEALIDENKFKYGLDTIAKERLGRTKDESSLLAAAYRLGIKTKHIKQSMHLFHASDVGPYAETDAELPIEIFKKQEPILKDDYLWDVFILETRLTDLLVEMRQLGVPVNVNRAEEVDKELERQEKITHDKIKWLSGIDVSVWAADSISKAFDKMGIPYPRTAKTKVPSFTAPWLESHTSELAKLVLEERRINKMRSTFITNMVINSSINGRIHPEFNPVKHDDGGTVSGRFSSSNPNLQQVPSRHPVFGPLIRGLFSPEPGCLWCKCDYSQQEPRVTVHYAYARSLPGAREARDRYIENPDTDYHTYVAELCACERRLAKDINLGLAYGMGVPKMAEKLGLTVAATRILYNTYHAKVRYMKPLANECSNFAAQRGWIRTILGRKRHFNLFYPPDFRNETIAPLPYDEAIAKWGQPVRPAFTHKALNALIQGSSADMVKKAMLDCYDAGIIPHLTVHDELDCSVESPEQGKVIKEIMLNAIKLEVPLKVDMFIEENWGKCK